jgi:invasion protein IalB
MHHWLAVSTIGVLLSGSASAALVAPVSSAANARAAYVRDGAAAPLVRQSQAQTPPAAATPPAATAPSAPQHIETTVYDSWSVTCQDGARPAAGAAKKTCMALLRVMTEDRRQVLIGWQIGTNEQGRYVTVIRVPTGLAVRKDNQTTGGGILVQNGVELKFGNGTARKLNFVSCNPQQCAAEAPVDDAFIKDVGTNTTATVTVYTVSGQGTPFEVPIKGIDKAISSTRGK